MKKLLVVLIGLMVIGSLLLTACKPEAVEPAVEEAVAEEETAPAEEVSVEEAPAAEEEESEVIKGGTLYWHEGVLVHFDPPFIVDTPSFHVASLVYSFLFRLGANGSIIPDLAESWEYENEGKSVVFHLRQGVYFQDGNEVFAEGEAREVVASDVVYSLERMATVEGTQAPSDYLQNFESVEAIDDYTVRLNLKNPDALLFVMGRGITGAGILPQEAVEHFGDLWSTHPIGSGPFQMDEYIPDESVTLSANEDHWVVPNVDGIVIKIIPDETVAGIALEAGEIYSMVTLTTSIVEQFEGNEDFVQLVDPCPFNYYVQFNMTNPLLAQYEVRKAIAHAVDGALIMKTVVGGLYVGGCGTAGPGVPGYDENLCEKYMTYDPELAAQVLTDAGWAKNANSIWEKDGQTLTFNMEIWNSSPMPDIATAVLTQLQEFGADATLTQVEFGTWIDDYYGGNPPDIMFHSGFCGDGGLNALWGTNGLSYQLGYSNEEAATMLDGANYIVDPLERDDVLRRAQEMIFQDYPLFTLGFTAAAEIVNSKVMDYHGSTGSLNLVTGANNVWLVP